LVRIRLGHVKIFFSSTSLVPLAQDILEEAMVVFGEPPAIRGIHPTVDRTVELDFSVVVCDVDIIKF